MALRQNKHFTLEEITAGIYAAIAKEGTGAVANAGIIDLGDQTIIFDTFNTQQAANELREMAEHYCPSPISYVINSHWHGDHIRGNQVFSDKAILSSEITFNKMRTTHPERILKQKSTLDELTAYIASLLQEQTVHFDSKRQIQIDFLKEIETSLPGLELVLPSETFTKEYTFTGSKRTGHVFTHGGGHSICDAMLYLPEDKVLFTGDLLFVNIHPSLFPESDPSQWITILEKIADLEIDLAVPGHGPVGTQANVIQLINYFNLLMTFAKEEESLDTLAIPEMYQNWDSPEMFSQTLKLLKETLLVED